MKTARRIKRIVKATITQKLYFYRTRPRKNVVEINFKLER